MKVLSVDEACGLLFSKLGFCISQYPKIFIFASMVFAASLSVGIARIKYIRDVEYLFSIEDGPVWKEAEAISQLFPQNSTNEFSISRLVRPGKFARLIVQRRDGHSILDLDTWAEIMNVDSVVKNVSIKWNNEVRNYGKLCASWKGQCYQNSHLGLGSLLPQFLNGTLRLSYPVMFDPINFQVYTLNLFFGGVNFRNGSTSTVESIKTISLDYFVRNDTIDDEKRGLEWESSVMEHLAKLNSKDGALKIDYMTQLSFDEETERSNLSAPPYITVTCLVTLIFAICTSYTGNWVTSKPWLSFMGMAACLLGVVAAFGFLALIGVPLTSVNAGVPFIALGVGIDDTFVMMASWWRTSRSDFVSKRMAECYADAGISITVTTLTDMLSFYVGIWSDVPSIKIFCAYAGTSVFFIYLIQIFCFGGFMAISGRHEEENRHSFYPWKKVKSTDLPASNLKEGNSAMEFFRDSFAPFVSKPSTKVVSVIIYVAYVGLSVLGILNMKQGLENRNIASWDSYMTSYYDTFDKYYREYPYRSQVVITTPLDYSKKEVQEMVGNYMYNLTHLEGMTPEYGENWLKDFLRFANNYKEFYNFTIDTEQDFIDVLREYYLRDGDSVYSVDVKFNDNHTKIIGSRFVVQHHKVRDAQAEKDLIENFRALAASEKHMNVTVYNPFNILTEVSVTLKGQTLKLVGAASFIVITVTVLFMPNLLVCLFTLLSIASVQLGVVGFISLSGVNLDFVSVTALIMCIGFSVDFPAHLMFAYVKSKKESAQARIDEALYALAWPIVQGAASTVIAVSGLYLVNSYIFQVIFKILCLVLLFSTFNTFFILPQLVVLFSCRSTSKQES